MKPRKSFLLRISPDLYEALDAWAQQELRSVNGQIEFILKQAVQNRGHKLKAEQAANGDRADPTDPSDLSAR